MENYEALFSEQFEIAKLDPFTTLKDLQKMYEYQNKGYLVHTNMPYGMGGHADNLRAISYYSNNKVVLHYRVGSYKLSSVNTNWLFYLLKGVK